MSDIETHRAEIDKIDRKIIDLLNKRVGNALEIVKIKEAKKLPYYHPEREKEIINALVEYNKGDLFPNKGVAAIFGEIISAVRSLEKQLQVAYLGPQGSYTHLACLEHFGSAVETVPLSSIGDIFKELENGKVDYGIVPVENSQGGIVNYTLDGFVDSSLMICSERFLQVSHCLLSNLEDLSEVKRLYGHSQSFVQCRSWIDNNLPSVERIETSSNSKAASLVEWDKYSAAIASEVAAKVYKLSVLERNIQDSSNNITRFLVIGNNECRATGDDKTSLIFTISDDIGALVDILTPFSKRSINLTKIESRPSKKKAWDYLFFMDIDGHISLGNVQEALKEASKACLHVKVIGSYPKGIYPH